MERKAIAGVVLKQAVASYCPEACSTDNAAIRGNCAQTMYNMLMPPDTTSPTSTDPAAATAETPVADPSPSAPSPASPVENASEPAPAVQNEPLDAVPPESVTAQTVGNEPLSSPAPAPAVIVRQNNVKEYLAMALERISGKKAKRLTKIMAEVERRGTMTNDQVEKLLHVSDATATRYLSELVKQGRLEQTGRTGKWVSYRRRG